jgi:hypothetical protein
MGPVFGTQHGTVSTGDGLAFAASAGPLLSANDLRNAGATKDAAEAASSLRFGVYALHAMAYDEWLRRGSAHALSTADSYLPSLRVLARSGNVLRAAGRSTVVAGPVISSVEVVTGYQSGDADLQARGMGNLAVDGAILSTGPLAVGVGPLWAVMNLTGARDAWERRDRQMLDAISRDGIWRPIYPIY